jgi:hypothetical protein
MRQTLLWTLDGLVPQRQWISGVVKSPRMRAYAEFPMGGKQNDR